MRACMSGILGLHVGLGVRVGRGWMSGEVMVSEVRTMGVGVEKRLPRGDQHPFSPVISPAATPCGPRPLLDLSSTSPNNSNNTNKTLAPLFPPPTPQHPLPTPTALTRCISFLHRRFSRSLAMKITLKTRLRQQRQRKRMAYRSIAVSRRRASGLGRLWTGGVRDE